MGYFVLHIGEIKYKIVHDEFSILCKISSFDEDFEETYYETDSGEGSA